MREEHECATVELKSLQMNNTSPKLSKKKLETKLNPFGVEEEENDIKLITKIGQEDFTNGKLNTIQAPKIYDNISQEKILNSTEFNKAANEKNDVITDSSNINSKSDPKMTSETNVGSEVTKSSTNEECLEDDDPYAVDIYADNSSSDDIEVLPNERVETPDLYSENNICSGEVFSYLNSSFMY